MKTLDQKYNDPHSRSEGTLVIHSKCNADRWQFSTRPHGTNHSRVPPSFVVIL